jgi:ParB family transcriptional regulator, chromosome partitioning protein
MDLEIPLDQIEIAAGRRAVDPGAVDRLSQSIAAVGLQHRITVCKRNGAYVLVAGRHRIEACRKLGIERIPANVVDLNTLEAELLEIDENLARNELSPAERTAAIVRRKTVYEELHPETKHGAIGGGHGNASAKADRFTKVTAEATGRSERVIQRDAARGETLGQETLARIAYTSLDKGIELDALAKLPVDDRDALVVRAANGEAVSAVVTERFDFDGWDCTDEEKALAYAFMERAEKALGRDFPEAAPKAPGFRAFCAGVKSLRLSTLGSRAHLAGPSLCPKITFPRKRETGSTDMGLFRRMGVFHARKAKADLPRCPT